MKNYLKYISSFPFTMQLQIQFNLSLMTINYVIYQKFLVVNDLIRHHKTEQFYVKCVYGFTKIKYKQNQKFLIISYTSLF